MNATRDTKRAREIINRAHMHYYANTVRIGVRRNRSKLACVAKLLAHAFALDERADQCSA